MLAGLKHFNIGALTFAHLSRSLQSFAPYTTTTRPAGCFSCFFVPFFPRFIIPFPQQKAAAAAADPDMMYECGHIVLGTLPSSAAADGDQDNVTDEVQRKRERGPHIKFTLSINTRRRVAR